MTEVSHETVINAWVENLTSGKFLQGVGALNKSGKLCCLGVLCETGIQLGMSVERSGSGLSGTWNGTIVAYRASDADYWDFETIGDALAEMFGLTDGDLKVLMAMNDGAQTWNSALGEAARHDQLSFSEIADWIKENIELKTDEPE